jgi:riboflavin synthase
MFTGIIAAVGHIASVTPLSTTTDNAQAGLRLTIDAGVLPLADVMLGDSIAINGACMTVVSKSDHQFSIDISRESLNLTTGLDQMGPVNLEKALTLADRIGGHLVSGHVDGLGRVIKFEPINESFELIIAAPLSLAKYLAHKGSVVINGVSLTVNSVVDHPDHCAFSINLIPHTIAVTTLKHLRAGSKVNLEIDLIARYCERMLSYQHPG